MVGKDEVLSMFQKFVTRVELQSCKKLKCLWTNNGGEYVSGEFKSKNDAPNFDEERASMAKIPYCLALGSLMYAMVATRPDIAFAVGVVSRFMADLGRKHWDAVKGILHYLSGTADKCVCFGDGDAFIVGYTNANYARNVDNRRSTFGYIFTFAGGVIS